MLGRTAESLEDVGVDLGCGEGIGGNMREAHERVHDRKLPWIIDLEPRNALSRWGNCRLRKFSELTAVDGGLQNIRLSVEVIIVHGR